MCVVGVVRVLLFFFFQAEDGIRDLVRSRGLGDVYKRQVPVRAWRFKSSRGHLNSCKEKRDRCIALFSYQCSLSLIHI